jgi:hypothetical protein
LNSKTRQPGLKRRPLQLDRITFQNPRLPMTFFCPFAKATWYVKRKALVLFNTSVENIVEKGGTIVVTGSARDASTPCTDLVADILGLKNFLKFPERF